MPILKNAKKALRVSKRKTVINSRVKSRIKTMTDAFKKNPTASALRQAFSAVDSAVKKNIIKKNKAARVKSQLSKMLPASETGVKKVAVVAPKKAAVKKATKKAAPKKTAKK